MTTILGRMPLDQTTPQELLQLAREIAHSAGEILLNGRPDAPRAAVVSTSTKTSPTDIVTERDIMSEKAIVEAITQHRPHDAILGEEGTNRDGTSGLTWIVDPLDGTINYLYGSPQWAVSIAVADEDGPLVGVVYAPAVTVEYWAIRGHGAWREDTHGVVQLPQIEDVELAHALFATGFGYRTERRVQQAQVIATVLPKIRDIRRKGSAALDLCMVGAGMVNGYFERGAHPWDYSAGALVASETGAIVSGLHGKPAGVDMVVAAPPRVHAGITALLESLNADQGD
jgi:fructose-1,6-bisphosphatase/inositol monophosphatase family enzyme